MNHPYLNVNIGTSLRREYMTTAATLPATKVVTSLPKPAVMTTESVSAVPKPTAVPTTIPTTVTTKAMIVATAKPQHAMHKVRDIGE